MYLLTLVHNLLLAPDLYGCQFFHRLLVVAETLGDFLVEGVHQVLQRAGKGFGEVVVCNVGGWRVRVVLFVFLLD